MAAQRLGLLLHPVVALQQSNIADRIRNMGEDAMMVLFDRFLVLLGAAHDEAADHDVGRAECKQHNGQAPVERNGGRDQQD
jgi:hypothetical protein